MGETGNGVRSRRQVLAAGLTGGLGLALGACSATRAATVTTAARVGPAGSDIGAIKHVVFLMLENRSFDHYFGTYRGVRGFDDPDALPGVFEQVWPGGRDSHLLPFHLNTLTSDAECIADLTHAWQAQHECFDGGKNDRFAAVHTSSANEGAKGVVTMGYYTRADISFHYALADAFTICDGYHCSVFGPTHPNRLMAQSGTLDPAGEFGGPVLDTYSDASRIGSARWRSLPEALEDKGVSWKSYGSMGSVFQPSSSLSIEVSDNILLYFHGLTADPSSDLYKRAFTPVYPNDLLTDVRRDELPSVSWISPPIGYDEHPSGPPAAGEALVHQVLSILTSNPAVWAKTALFVMYDENDGFFDHVPPPTAPPGTAGEYVTASSPPAPEAGIDGPIGLGFRVPMVVVSPFSRGGYVASDVYDHTSQLLLVETLFGVEAPNLSDWRRRTVGDLTAALQPGRPDTSIPALPATDARSALVTRECTSLELVTVEPPNMAPYPVPLHQALPHQEPGARRGVPGR